MEGIGLGRGRPPAWCSCSQSLVHLHTSPVRDGCGRRMYSSIVGFTVSIDSFLSAWCVWAFTNSFSIECARWPVIHSQVWAHYTHSSLQRATICATSCYVLSRYLLAWVFETPTLHNVGPMASLCVSMCVSVLTVCTHTWCNNLLYSQLHVSVSYFALLFPL